MNILKKLQAYLAIRSICKKADAQFKLDGKRRFVIPFTDGSIEVLTADEAITLKVQGLLPADFSKRTIYGSAYYWTDTNSRTSKVKGRMPKREELRRRAAYYQWFDRHHK